MHENPNQPSIVIAFMVIALCALFYTALGLFLGWWFWGR